MTEAAWATVGPLQFLAASHLMGGHHLRSPAPTLALLQYKCLLVAVAHLRASCC